MIGGMLDSEMIEDAAKIVNEAIKEKVRVNLFINDPAGGNASPFPLPGWGRTGYNLLRQAETFFPSGDEVSWLFTDRWSQFATPS
jgi:hypothetical protein